MTKIDPYWKAANVICELAAKKAYEFAYDNFVGMDGRHHADLARRDGNEAEADMRQAMHRFFLSLSHFVSEQNMTNWGNAAAEFAGLVRNQRGTLP